MHYKNICIDVWGPFAMFTRPESKVERLTYPTPTPSACRGILNAIYCKRLEFYYEIEQIDVMNPIRLMTLRRNEVTTKADAKKAANDPDYCIDPNKVRTQRMCTYIRDVYYRIHAKIVMRDDAPSNVNLFSISDQFNRRAKNGKCFYQPWLGTRECACHFSLPDYNRQPLDISENIGIMLYDVFDIKSNIKIDTSREGKKKSGKTQVSFFNAVLEHGSVHVPAYDSGELLVTRRNENV